MTASARTRREWLLQAIAMRRTGTHPDGRPLGPVLAPRLDIMISNLAASLAPRAVSEARH